MIMLLEDRRFYVYVFLDPTKPGIYKYGEYEFDHEPFYVGKGLNRRMFESRCRSQSNTFKYNKIQKLIRSNSKPILFKYAEYLTEREAFDCEIDMIRIIGRRDIGKGPLTNLTTGGEGPSGYICSEKLRIIRRKNRLGKSLSEKSKEKCSISKRGDKNPNYGRSLSREIKIKISDKIKGDKHPFFGKHRSEETRRKISKTKKGKPSSNKGKHLSEETKKKISKANKGNHHFSKQLRPIIINNKYFYCIIEASRKLNIPYITVKRRLKNKNFPNYKYVSSTDTE